MRSRITTGFVEELRNLINRHSIEPASDTPDHVLAGFLADCLRAWELGIESRSNYNGERKHRERVIELEHKLQSVSDIVKAAKIND